mmetsp:Transcript_14633/g.27503  ORF Transcript_14633/g.27503 Transcript_14633/m.27503 type:complete len:877 (-) Transcript_14633:149-2779(-)
MFTFSNRTSSSDLSRTDQEQERREEEEEEEEQQKKTYHTSLHPLSSIFCGASFRDTIDSIHDHAAAGDQDYETNVMEQQQEKGRLVKEDELLQQLQQHYKDESRDEVNCLQQQERSCNIESISVLDRRCEEEEADDDDGDDYDAVTVVLQEEHEDFHNGATSSSSSSGGSSSSSTILHDDGEGIKPIKESTENMHDVERCLEEQEINHEKENVGIIDCRDKESNDDDDNQQRKDSTPGENHSARSTNVGGENGEETNHVLEKQQPPFEDDAPATQSIVLTDLLQTFMLNVSTHGRYSLEVATTLQSLGTFHENCGELEDAFNCYQESLEIYSANLGDHSAEVVNMQHRLGRVNCNLGNNDEALRLYSRVLNMMSHQPNKYENVDCAHVRLDISKILHCKGLHNEAITELKQTLKCFRECHGNDHESVAKTMRFMADVWTACGKRERAIGIRHELNFDRNNNTSTARILPSSQSTKSSIVEIANMWQQRAVDHEQNGKLHAALRAMKKSYDVLCDSQGPDIPANLEKCMEKIGLLYSKLGKIDKTIKAYKSVASLRKQVYGECSVELASSYLALGKAYVEASQHEKALKALNRAMACYSEISNQANTADCFHEVMDVMHTIGNLHYQSSNYRQALEVLEKEKNLRQDQQKCQSASTSTITTEELETRNDYSFRGGMDFANTMLLLGKTQYALEMFAEAKNTLMDALEHYDKMEGRKINFAEALFFYGKALEGLCDKSCAVTCFKESYQICMANGYDEDLALMKKVCVQLCSMNFMDTSALEPDFACEVMDSKSTSTTIFTSAAASKNFPRVWYNYICNLCHRLRRTCHHLFRISKRFCCSLLAYCSSQYRGHITKYMYSFFDFRHSIIQSIPVFSSL